MKLDHEFAVGVPVGQAWAVLTDLELIAPCLPGAVLTGVDDGVYTGKVKIKVGPVSAEYSGTAQFTEKDESAYRAVISARGRDSRGNGNATAVISAHLQADGTSTRVSVSTDLTIAGRIAQFGSGMIKEVSARLLGQFAQCLESRLGGDLAAGEPAAVSAASAGSAAAGAADHSDGPATERAAVEGAGTEGVGTEGVASAAAANTASAVTSPVLAAAGPEPEALNLMSVAGRAVSKRLVPVLLGIVVIAVVIYLIVR